MDSIEEKRVYAGGDSPAVAYVASSTGLVRANVAGELVGEFSLLRRDEARDVAADAGSVAVATAEDVLIADEAASTVDRNAFVGTGFGPAVAVGALDGDLLAADEDGRVARRRDGEWNELEPTLAAVRAIDGDLIATADGAYRVRGDELVNAGLEDVRDVSAPGRPLAATGSGLYALGNGWMLAREGSAAVVAADPGSETGRLGRAYAVVDDALLAFDDGEWRELDRPGDVVDFGYGETVYAVTADGEFLSRTADGWRSRNLGIVDVVGMALPRP